MVKKIFSIIILMIFLLQQFSTIALASTNIQAVREVEELATEESNGQILMKSENDNEINLESTKYLILEEHNIITRIIPETTIQEFTGNFNVASTNLQIYEDLLLTQRVTQGYIKTGMYLTYNGLEEPFELSVIGDINKDGVMDQIDLTRLIRHVIKHQGAQIQGIAEKSADISGDGIINQIDVTRLIRYIVQHELNIPEIKRPKAPLITVVSGEEGEDGWYKGDVQVKISEDTTSEVKIGKTIYKVTGNTQIQETQIQKQTTITIRAEGESKVTAYSYSEEGARSAIESKVIKIDNTVPEIIEVEAKSNSKSITVEVEATDTLSGVKEYVYYLGTENAQGDIVWGTGIKKTDNSHTFDNLENNKEYNVKVEVIDKAGNKAEEQIEKTTTDIPELFDDKKAAEEGTIPNITIEKSEEDWTNQNVVIKAELDDSLKQNNEYTLEYSKDNGVTWENYDENDGIVVEKNTTVQMRLTDGVNSGEGIEVEVSNIDKLEPNDFTPTATATSNSITVTGSTTDQQATAEYGCSGIDKYYFSKDGGVTWEPADGQQETSYTFSGLTPNTSYDIKMKAVDKAGNETIASIDGENGTSQITTGTISGEDVLTFTPSEGDWTNEDVTVTITTTETGYDIQYSTDGTNWYPYTDPITIPQNGTIHAKLTDGDIEGDSASYTVDNIDKNLPSATIQAEQNVVTNGSTGTITATVTQADGRNESGVDVSNSKYIINTSSGALGTNNTAWNNATSFTGNELTQNIEEDGFTEGTYYIHVLTKDNAGNMVETISSPITVSGPVARIGQVYYATLEAAIDDVPSQQQTTIELLKDVTETINTNSSYQNIILNTAGYDITSSNTNIINSRDTVTIGGNGTVSGDIYVSSGAELNIQNITYKDDITNLGTLNIKSGTFSSNTITNDTGGTATISGGIFSSPKNKNSNGGVFTISGGTFESWYNMINNNGNFTITNGVFRNTLNSTHGDDYMIYNDTFGNFNITGGQFSANNNCIVYNDAVMTIGGTASFTNISIYFYTIKNSGDLTITGGTIRNTGGASALLHGGNCMYIRGGSITNNSYSYPTIFNDSFDLVISGGTVKNSSTDTYAYELSSYSGWYKITGGSCPRVELR